MCTGMALTRQAGFYFGRNMDIDRSFGERVVITPRNYPLSFKEEPASRAGHAVIGMGSVVDGYPLYADAVNEKGLCVSSQNFPGYAHYAAGPAQGRVNLSAYELISWVLSRYASVDEAYGDLLRLNLLAIPFKEGLPVTPMHWLVSDRERSVVVEQTVEGLSVLGNPVGVMTNNPPFGWHLTNLRQYLGVRPEQPENVTWGDLELRPLGEGQGAFGLPGDFSPVSRFVKAAFLRNHATFGDTEEEIVTQFFHVLDAVAMVRGSVALPGGWLDETTYSSCVSVEKGIYYYKTYGNSQISAVSLHHENLDGRDLIVHELRGGQSVFFQNGAQEPVPA